MRSKRGSIFDFLPPWILALLVLVLTLLIYSIMSGTLTSAIETLKQWLRFG